MVDGINTDSLSAYQQEIIDTLTALGIDAEINLFDADGVYNADKPSCGLRLQRH
jgi:hypothetical protein